MAYYLHDKGSSTAERVAWTETRNLATNDPATAMRVMIATAQRSDELKAAAGVANTGRKSTKAVYAYSLAWHPDEAGKIDRAEMMRAVESSLIAIGAEGLQALVVCHQDEPHPHVHVVVNRVDPDTGRMYAAKNDFRQLDAWALAYREARGEHLTYCPARAEKRDRIAAAKSPEKAQEPPKPSPAPHPPLVSQGAALAAAQGEMRAKHRREWEALSASYKAARDSAWKQRASFKAIAAQHRADTRADWSAFGKQQARERRAFNANERSIAGRLTNALSAVNGRGLYEGQKGFLRAVFRHVLSAPDRAAPLAQQQAATKAAFAAQMQTQLDAKIAAAKADHAGRLERASLAYQAAKADLIARQRQERAAVSEAWQRFYAERDQAHPRGGRSWSRTTAAQRNEKARRAAFDKVRAARSEPIPARADRGAKPWREQAHANRFPTPSRPQDAAQRQEPKTMQHDFDEARKLAAANRFAAPSRTAPVPAPQPTPMGAAPAPQQRQDVPKVDKAAAWAKTPEGQKVVDRQAQKVAPDPLRAKAAEAFRPAQSAPATPAEAPAPNRDIWSRAATPAAPPEKTDGMRDIWRDAAKPERKPMRERGRGRDDDFGPER